MSIEPEVRTAPRRVRFIALGLAAFIGAAWAGWAWWHLGSRSAAPVLFTTSGEVVSAPYSITVVQHGRVIREKDLRNVVDTALQRADWLLSPTDPNSETSRFNATKSIAPFRVSPETAEVVACALKVSERTVGAYDPTAAPLFAAYMPKSGQAPDISDAQLAALRAHVGYEKLSVDSTAPALIKGDPEITIDLHAALAGFAADLVARALDKRSIENYAIKVGDQTRVKGRDATDQVWPVQAGSPSRALGAENTAAGRADTKGSTVVDARSGKPVTHAMESVTVFHAEAMWAQAYANAMLVLGPEDGFLMAKLLKLPAIAVLRGPGDTREERTTPAFEERFGADRSR